MTYWHSLQSPQPTSSFPQAFPPMLRTSFSETFNHSDGSGETQLFRYFFYSLPVPPCSHTQGFQQLKQPPRCPESALLLSLILQRPAPAHLIGVEPRSFSTGDSRQSTHIILLRLNFLLFIKISAHSANLFYHVCVSLSDIIHLIYDLNFTHITTNVCMECVCMCKCVY